MRIRLDVYLKESDRERERGATRGDENERQFKNDRNKCLRVSLIANTKLIS